MCVAVRRRSRRRRVGAGLWRAGLRSPAPLRRSRGPERGPVVWNLAALPDPVTPAGSVCPLGLGPARPEARRRSLTQAGRKPSDADALRHEMALWRYPEDGGGGARRGSPRGAGDPPPPVGGSRAKASSQTARVLESPQLGPSSCLRQVRGMPPQNVY